MMVAATALLLTVLAAEPVQAETYRDRLTGMEFVFVKGGCYQMGDGFGDGESDEMPSHEVCVGDYYIGKYEVTQSEWLAVMGTNPAHVQKGGSYPVDQVTWDLARHFIETLNKKTEKTYRFPTEAEWEYAARSGGKKEKWAGTSDPRQIDAVAWFKENSGSEPHPVGRKEANSLGIHDMSGNVWEWVQDWYDESYYAQSPRKDPPGPSAGRRKVLRGGSWGDVPLKIRTSDRGKNEPYKGDQFDGLRIAFSPKGQGSIGGYSLDRQKHSSASGGR